MRRIQTTIRIDGELVQGLKQLAMKRSFMRGQQTTWLDCLEEAIGKLIAEEEQPKENEDAR